jgi:ATP-dependent RNA helicase DDX55/SPB4
MPELKKANKDDWRDDDLNVRQCLRYFESRTKPALQWVEYGFTDKARESQRLATLSAENQKQIKEKRAEQASKRAQLKQKNDAWSKKVAKRQEKEKRKEKRGKKREWLKSQATSEKTEPSGAGAPKRPAEEDADDWDELAREERMMKKVKRGQVDSKDFDNEFGGL